MPRKSGQREKYFDEEDVITSYQKYHRVSCTIVGNIEARNRKRLRSWKDAVALGLVPCRVCKPYHESPSTNATTPESLGE